VKKTENASIVAIQTRFEGCMPLKPGKKESFFATLKKERIHHESHAGRAAARQSVLEYISPELYGRLLASREPEQ
jgi:hypothetical protein